MQKKVKFWFHYKDLKLCLIKIPMQKKFKLLTVIFFSSKYYAFWQANFHHKIDKLPCILNDVGFTDSVLTYQIEQIGSLLCHMMVYKMVNNYLIL